MFCVNLDGTAFDLEFRKMRFVDVCHKRQSILGPSHLPFQTSESAQTTENNREVY